MKKQHPIRNVKGRFVRWKTLKKSMNKAAAMSKARTIFGVKRKLTYGSDENEFVDTVFTVDTCHVKC